MTEFVEMPNRGHGLVVDGGWREVADTALAFVQRFVPGVAVSPAASVESPSTKELVSAR